MRDTKTYKAVFFIFLFIFIYSTEGQVLKDSKGKDFWLTFIPNFHNNKYAQGSISSKLDTLSIFITSSKPTQGEIRYRDINSKVYIHSFSITDPNQMYIFQLNFRNFELEGFNDSGVEWSQNQSEKIAPQSFHITSDEEISVYALNQATYTSDAFLVFPTDVLGEYYYILSYNGDGQYGRNEGRTPSQFAIVASEDGTNVVIKPSTPTYTKKSKPYTVVLNQGDVYLVQSAFDMGTGNPDLTGTVVEADKPIAVFSGHQRAKVPITIPSLLPSRDILVEQLQPYKNWGKNAFIIPLVQPYNITAYGNDLFRIIAAKDSTNIFLNGKYITTLNSAEFFEAPADQTFIVNSNKPISVAQYKKTSNNFGSDFNISDPYMLIIPPKEQYLNSYRIISIKSWDYSSSKGFFPAFTEHYISLIVPDTAINSIEIDSVKVPANKFKPIPGSKYYYLNYPTSAGVHSVTGSAPFGIYVTGFGEANSYGYLGGMNFNQLNYRPPQILSSSNCDEIDGILTKFGVGDFGIWDVAVSDSNNVDVAISAYTPGDSAVNFQAKLKDIRRDGSFTISVTDSLQNKREKTFTINGFTVGLVNDTLPDTLKVINFTTKPRRKLQGNLDIINFGNVNKQISQVWFIDSAFVLKSQQNFRLKPAEIQSLIYEFYFDAYQNKDTVLIDTLWIADDCFRLPLAILRVVVKGDSNFPVSRILHSSCDTMSVVTVADSLDSDFGLMSYEILKSSNCIVTNTLHQVKKFEFTIYQIDKSLDAVYEINVIDSARNLLHIVDTILGNNMFIDFIDSNNVHSFGRKTIGMLWCDSLLINNRSDVDIRIDNLYLERNVEFSIPLSQFPFIVPAGESKSLFVCFNPGQVTTGKYRDKIIIDDDCIKKEIILEGEVVSLVRSGHSQCGANMTLVTTKVPKNFFVDNLYPNPVSERGKINIAIPQKAGVKVKVFDIIGRELLKFERDYSAGLYTLELNLSQLKQGVYFLSISYLNQIQTIEFRKL